MPKARCGKVKGTGRREDTKTEAGNVTAEKVDSDACPKSIVVLRSGKAKVNGTYLKGEALVKERPFYRMDGSPPMYIYWNKKWIISSELGDRKSLMHLDDVGLAHPCEPYPRRWIYYVKDESGKKLEVIDCAIRLIGIYSEEDTERVKAEQEFLLTLPCAADRCVPRRCNVKTSPIRSGPAPVSESVAPPEPGEGVEGRKEDAVSRAPQKGEHSASEDGSESDSSESASSSSSSSRPIATSSSQAIALVAEQAAADPNADKRSKFESQLLSQFERLPHQGDGREKLQKLKLGLTQQRYLDMGYDDEKVRCLLARLEALLSKMPPAHVQPVVQCPAGKGDASTEKRNALPHRTLPAPKRSKLKIASCSRRAAHERIQYVDGDVDASLFSEIPVESFRHFGNQLWFTMPGAVVVCDICEQGVPQAHGCLQGAPEKSQFAQNQFVCVACMGLTINGM